jgi:hypothetical protein
VVDPVAPTEKRLEAIEKLLEQLSSDLQARKAPQAPSKPSEENKPAVE